MSVHLIQGEEVWLERHKAAAVIVELGYCSYLPMFEWYTQVHNTHRIAGDTSLCECLHQGPGDRRGEIQMESVIPATDAAVEEAREHTTQSPEPNRSPHAGLTILV